MIRAVVIRAVVKQVMVSGHPIADVQMVLLVTSKAAFAFAGQGWVTQAQVLLVRAMQAWAMQASAVPVWSARVRAADGIQLV